MARVLRAKDNRSRVVPKCNRKPIEGNRHHAKRPYPGKRYKRNGAIQHKAERRSIKPAVPGTE